MTDQINKELLATLKMLLGAVYQGRLVSDSAKSSGYISAIVESCQQEIDKAEQALSAESPVAVSPDRPDPHNSILGGLHSNATYTGHHNVIVGRPIKDASGVTIFESFERVEVPQPPAQPSVNDILIEALQCYADQNHFVLHDESAWDSVSGEPTNFLEDENNTATVETGWVARIALERAEAAKRGES